MLKLMIFIALHCMVKGLSMPVHAFQTATEHACALSAFPHSCMSTSNQTCLPGRRRHALPPSFNALQTTTLCVRSSSFESRPCPSDWWLIHPWLWPCRYTHRCTHQPFPCFTTCGGFTLSQARQGLLDRNVSVHMLPNSTPIPVFSWWKNFPWCCVSLIDPVPAPVLQ